MKTLLKGFRQFALLIALFLTGHALVQAQTIIGGVNMGHLTDYHMIFTNGSTDANWQSASKGYVGDVAIDGIQADERTSGSFAYAGTIYTNDVTLDAWQDIVDNNTAPNVPATQAFGSYSEVARIAGLETDLANAFAQINALPVTAGYNGVSATSLNNLNTMDGIATTYVININSGLQVSSQINITGDAGDVFILRWDADNNLANGYNGQVKFQSGGAIVPNGGLLPSNFISVAGDINSSGGGSNPPAPYPQGPRTNNGTGSLITDAVDFNGGGFFTGYWLTTGDPGNLQTQSLSNAIFVGAWYTSTVKFTLTSGSSGVYVAPNPSTTCNLSLSATHLDVSCSGANDGSIDITVSGAHGAVTYLWNDGVTTEDRSGLAPGIYTVTVTDAWGCQVFDAYSISELAVLQVSGSAIDVSVVNGANGSIDVSVTGGTMPYSYLWNDGATTEDRSNLAPGDYTVTVTDAHGCSSSSSFTIHPYVCTLTVDAGADINKCHNDPMMLHAYPSNPNVTYMWKPSASLDDKKLQNPTTNVMSTTTFTVTVTGADGCVAVDSVVVYVAPTVKAKIKVVANDGSCAAPAVKLSTPYNANYSYTWRYNKAEATIGDIHSSTYCATQSGTYSVWVVDTVYNCEHHSKKVDITIVPKMADAAVQSGNMELNAWPNPVSDNLYVSAQNLNTGVSSIQLFDIFGRQINTFNFDASESNSSQTYAFNMKSLPAGFYVVTLTNGNTKISQKVMLVK